MKKLLIFFVTVVSLFLINSCREDGDWENESQFTFSVERDNNFIEKSIGEANQIKFNINPSYDFQSIKTSFKFVTNQNGVLKLNGQVLTANQVYDFENKDNIFEYTGNVSGNHVLKITASNDKGFEKVEEFTMPFAVAEFSHTSTGGQAPIYQGDETLYTMKIVAGQGQPTTGYQIKFNTYTGDVKFNGVSAQLDQWYPINNIDNFSTSLTTNQKGQGKLTYSIKNSTVSKDYEIQQNVLGRQITIESLNVNATSVLANSTMSLIGVIKKSPTTTNQTIQYKTWISSASNNNVQGIETTNNAYINYALGANGNIQLNFKALAVGTYTLNFQAKDEFGNESDVKSFNVVVAPEITFVGAMAMNVDFRYVLQFSGIRTYLKDFKRSFKAVAGGSATIVKIEYNITFDHMGQARNYNFTENVTNGTNTYEVTDANFGTGTSEMAYVTNVPNPPVTNLQAKIKATSSTGAVLEQTLTPTYNFTMGL